jgi:hypothetical protein
MSMRSISIVFEKKRFDKSRILNSKFVVISKALFSTFRREKIEIFDVSCDLWFRIRAQSIKRQKLDDVSQMMRKICLNSIYFFSQWFVFFHLTFLNNFVKFSRCAMRFIFFVDVSSSLSFQRIFRFRKAWLWKRNLLTKRRFLSNAKHIVELIKRKLQFKQHS